MEEENKKWYDNGFAIAGLNLGVFSFYTILYALIIGGIIGGLFDAISLLFHVIICIIFALVTKKWIWFLSGIIILIIGISFCSSINFINVSMPPQK